MKDIKELDEHWKSDVDEFFDKLRVTLPKWGKFLKKEMRKIINWYFFYQAKNDGEKALHIIMWSIATVGIVGWYKLAFGI
jgi:inorganic pyrophosphatase